VVVWCGDNPKTPSRFSSISLGGQDDRFEVQNRL
jgi:hypothetical protein